MSGTASHDDLWKVALPTPEEHQGQAFYEFQCYGCRFYHELAGDRGMDWGVCFNPASPYAGRVKFEHQGCAAYEQDDDA